jgi:amino acid adenylation domain-containing protein
LNHKFPHERLLKIASERNLMAVLCETKSTDQLQFLKNHSPILNYPHDSIYSEIQIAEGVKSEQAYTLFTSGSTGVPKGIPIEYTHLRALMEDLVERYPLGENDKVLQAFELSFDVSIACIFTAWIQGATLVVPDLNGITAINAFKAIYDHKVNFVTLPPSALFYLRRLKMLSMPLPWVTTTIFTGEALPINVAMEWKTCAVNTSIDNAYGPTEGTVWSLIYSLDDQTASQTINGLCPIGRPLKHIQMRVVDDFSHDVKTNERGELWIGGSQIFHGYVNQPEKSKEVVFQDNKGTYWYKTGDIVVVNDFGQVVYVNRKDNQVQINGFRVELGEVEHHLRAIIGSEAAVVLAHENHQVMELYSFVQGDWSESEILDLMRKKVPGYMLPRRIFCLEQLPVNTSGKVDKNLLREKYLKS